MKGKNLFFVLLILYVLSIIALNIDKNPWTIILAVLSTGAFLTYVCRGLIAEAAQMNRLMKEAKKLHKPIDAAQMERLMETFRGTSTGCSR